MSPGAYFRNFTVTRAEQITAQNREITRVALVAATKKKANPATDELRVENQNHGLA